MSGQSREYFKLNRSIFASFLASLTISAAFAQLISDQAAYANAIWTLAVDYTVYFTTFGILYYFSNRTKYVLESGSVNKTKLRRDLIRIITSLGISEIIYTIVRWLTQYHLITVGYEPYMASALSQGISFAVYILAINMSVKITRLYNDGS